MHRFWHGDGEHIVPGTLAKKTCLGSCASSWTVPHFSLTICPASHFTEHFNCLWSSHVGHLLTFLKIGMMISEKKGLHHYDCSIVQFTWGNDVCHQVGTWMWSPRSTLSVSTFTSHWPWHWRHHDSTQWAEKHLLTWAVTEGFFYELDFCFDLC